MNAVKRRVHWMRRTIDARRRRFFAGLDGESIRSFQTMYYWFIIAAGLYLAFGANGPPEAIAASLGHPYYEGWIWLNILCPLMTLTGRRMYDNAGKHTAPGEPNSSRAGATLQFGGDGGVWGLILVYTACLINTAYWGQPLYVTIYFLMGIPGGFLFTLRSWRRLRQIKRRESRMTVS